MKGIPRYVSVLFPGDKGSCLGRLFEDEPGVFYWSCYEMCPNTYRDMPEDAIIVYEYFDVDPDDDDQLEQIDIDHTRRFYPKIPVVISELEDNPAGWLDPGGRFYTCGYQGHDSLADALAGLFYNTTWNCVRTLEDNKWKRISSDGIIIEPFSRVGYFCTQAQLDTMFDLSESGKLTALYRETMKENLELYEVS